MFEQLLAGTSSFDNTNPKKAIEIYKQVIKMQGQLIETLSLLVGEQERTRMSPPPIPPKKYMATEHEQPKQHLATPAPVINLDPEPLPEESDFSIAEAVKNRYGG